MVNIITKSDGNNVIQDFESFFEKYVLARDFEDLDKDALKRIDNATLVEAGSDLIKTPFGFTDILGISTGCKVVLSYLYVWRNKSVFAGRILDVTGCGANALEFLFEYADKLCDSDTVFLLRHRNKITHCSNRDYSINGKHYTNLRAGVVENG